MKKILTIPVILILSSCSSTPIKTSEAATRTPLIYQQAATPKLNLSLPADTNPKKRYHSILELSKNFLPDQIFTDSIKNDDSALQVKSGFLPESQAISKEVLHLGMGLDFTAKRQQPVKFSTCTN